MVQYNNTQGLLNNKEKLRVAYKRHSNYFARSGIMWEQIKAFPQESKILDLGCAGGHFLKELLDKGYKNLDFVDFDNYLAYEELISLGKLRKVDLNYYKTPYNDENFDIVVALAILEHLENPFHFKREVLRVLKKGGLLFLAFPF